MISIDTNVLLRYILEDDVKQFEKASTLIQTNPPVLITDVVQVETVWTLTGKRYSFNKDLICTLIHGLLGDGDFIFENNQVIWAALRDYEESKPVRKKELDFADSLIFNKSQLVAKNKGTNLLGFYSFDKAMEQLGGVKSP